MSDLPFRYPNPPSISPSAQPALGVALALNVLLAAGVHLGMAFGTGAGPLDEITTAALHAAPVIYLALVLPIAALYGLAAAAWAGWSWWRVPFATLSAATLALGVNAVAMAHWISHEGWQVNPLLSAGDARLNTLLGLSGVSMVVLALVAASLWPRWLRAN